MVEALEQRRLLANVGIEAIDALAAEAGAATGMFRLTRDGELTDPLEVTISISGTATNGTDYEEVETTVTIPADSATADIVITPIDDATRESDETVIITVEDTENYDVTEGSESDTVTIIDNEKPQVSIAATDATASEDGGTGTFTITRQGTTTGTLTVKITISGTATNGTDYNTITSPVTISNGQASAVVTVTPKDDSSLEGSETVIVTLATDAAYTIASGSSTATVTISDDEKSVVSITASDSKATEGSSLDTATFKVSRTGSGAAIAGALVVKFAVTGTATDGTDYDTIGTSVTIPATKNSANVTIKTKQDSSVELSETVVLTLSSDDAYTINNDQKTATVTIADDDKPTVSIVAADATASETGTSNTGKFTISRTGPTHETLAVPITYSGLATRGTDYKSLPSSVTFAVGESSKSLVVRPIDDAALEGPETVIATLGSGAFIPHSTNKTATVTISEDEEPDVKIVATDATATEPTTDKAIFTLTRNGPTHAALVVDYTISGTATNGTDYTEIADSVTIPAGKSSATITITPKDDSSYEGPETVTLTLDDTATIDPDPDYNAATVALKDNEKPTVSISATDASAAEQGSATGTFTISRTSAATLNEAMTVTFTIGGTATRGVDYAAFDTKVTFAEGQTSKSITVTPVDDSDLEADETVILTLASGSTYTVSSTEKTATVTIDENELPTVSVKATDATATEPTTDTGKFTIFRNGPTVEALEVAYTVTGTATADTDYTALTGTATIAAGKSSVDVIVTPKDDTDLEGRETVIVTIDEDDAYLIDEDFDQATVNLMDNEKPTVSIAVTDDQATEDDEEDTAVITVSRTGPTTDPLEVLYTATGVMKPGVDSAEVLTGKVTIPAGQASKTITITPVDDATVETEETLTLTLKSATAYTVHSTNKAATITMIDDEKPTVSITAKDATGKEGTTDTIQLLVSRTGQTQNPLEVELTTSGSTLGALDLTTTFPSSVTIPAGKSFVTVTVAGKNDTNYEGTETLLATITENDAYIVDSENGSVEATLADDEKPTVSLAATDAAATETDNTTGTFTISRKEGEATTDPITVNLTISGTAKNGKDYNKIAKTVTIPAGEESATVTITPKTDTVVEGPETVILTLATGNYLINSSAKTGTVTIADAQKPTVSVEVIEEPATEDDEVAAVIRIWRTGQTTDQTLTVKFEMTGTADIGDDYTLEDENGVELTDQVTIPAGHAYVDIYVIPVDDSDEEDDETVILTLSTDSAYDIDGDNDQASIDIIDND